MTDAPKTQPISFSRGIMAMQQIQAERAVKRNRRPASWPVKLPTVQK